MPIGRVVITKSQPAETNSFYCWLGNAPNEPEPNIEIGSLLVAENETQTRRIIGMVESIQHTSATPDFVFEYYGSGYGNPSVVPPTQSAVIRLAKLRVLYREPQEARPPDGRWDVRYGTANDVELIAQRIPENCRILAGFVRMGTDDSNPDNWMPVYAHAEFLLGPEAAHLNISGVSGMATKSSYAIFLAYSILSWAQANEEPTAVVAFNVKRRDFLRLHQLPQSWEDFEAWLPNWAASIGGDGLASRVRAMWTQTRQRSVDPIALAASIRYFTFQGDPFISALPPGYQLYSYGFQDLREGDFMAGLFNYADEAEQQVNLLSRYLQDNLVANGATTFQTMLNDFTNAQGQNANAQQVTVRNVGTWMSGVVSALRRRLNGFLTPGRAGPVIASRAATGQPIRFASLQANAINVVQLHGLSDDAKRLVVNAVIREIAEGLDSAHPHIRRVLVIADELNKFAPAGKSSPIKEQLIDVVARGRDLRFSLAGAQQFASEVDIQVFGNAQTRIVGYTDSSEISHSIYRDLGDFREYVPSLQKGQMLFRHQVYPAPLLVWFPTPLHKLSPLA